MKKINSTKANSELHNIGEKQTKEGNVLSHQGGINPEMESFLKITVGLEVLKYFGFSPEFIFISDILQCQLPGAQGFIGGHSGFAANAITMLQMKNEGNFRVSIFGKGDSNFLSLIKNTINNKIYENKGDPLDVSLLGNGRFRSIFAENGKIKETEYREDDGSYFEELCPDSDFSEFRFRLNSAHVLGLMSLREAQSTEVGYKLLDELASGKIKLKSNTLLFVNSNLVVYKNSFDAKFLKNLILQASDSAESGRLSFGSAI